MKMFAISISVAFLLGVDAPSMRDTIQKGDVVVVPVQDEVAPSLLTFLRRAVKTAESKNASAIIFDMNTYGGRLDTATEIVNAFNQIKIPTYTFIDTNAGSAGALIVIATQYIYMAPVSAIGAAAPILSTGEDLPATANEKTISYWSALIRGSAIKNGHNPDLAEAFMNKEKEVKSATALCIQKARSSPSMPKNPPKRLTVNRYSLRASPIQLPISRRKPDSKETSSRSSQLASSNSHFGLLPLRLCCCLAEFSARIWNSRFPG